MKREFLEGLDLGNGVKLPKEAIEAIMAEHGKTKGALENTIATLTTERDGLQTQLDAANGEIQSFKDMDIDGIKRAAADWETKYNTDTQALKDQLAAKEYEYLVSGAVSDMKFTSDSAKRAFVADLTAKKLPLQDGKLIGLNEFVDTYKASDPGAFQTDKPAPTFVNPTQNPAPTVSAAALAAQRYSAQFNPTKE